MDLRERIVVSGTPVRLKPYTERRRKEFDALQKKIDDYIESENKKTPGVKFSEIPKSKKAEFWMQKAHILWDPQPEMADDGVTPASLPEKHWDKKSQFFTKSFFEDPDFEYPLLQKTEVFFLGQQVYL